MELGQSKLIQGQSESHHFQAMILTSLFAATAMLKTPVADFGLAYDMTAGKVYTYSFKATYTGDKTSITGTTKFTVVMKSPISPQHYKVSFEEPHEYWEDGKKLTENTSQGEFYAEDNFRPLGLGSSEMPFQGLLQSALVLPRKASERIEADGQAPLDVTAKIVSDQDGIAKVESNYEIGIAKFKVTQSFDRKKKAVSLAVIEQTVPTGVIKVELKLK